MKKPDFPWKWHTSPDKLVLSDFARYLVYLNHHLHEKDKGFKEAYKQFFNPILNDYKSGKLTNLKHGNNLATYVSELEQYLPSNVKNEQDDDVKKALNFYDKFKSYLTTYDDGLITAEDLVTGLRKFI